MIKKIIGFLTLLISINTLAQKNNISPYSFFGVGDRVNSKTVEEISMGGIGGASNSLFQLSFTNPASYASLRLTTYALAAENKSLRVEDGANKESASIASFSYLALGFPIGERAGVAFGIRPNTTVGYSLTQEFRNTDDELFALNNFTGEGGTNSVFLGFGHKIGKNFSLGLEAAYAFGSIENSLLNRRQGIPRATLAKSDTDISGITAKAGAQYHTKISEKLTLKTGLTVDISNELKNKGTDYIISVLNTNEDIIVPRDTTSTVVINENIKNPLKTILSAGIGEENKWFVGAEYAFQNALTFNIIEGNTNSNDAFGFTKSSRISIGGFYTPKFNSITSYWQRATYRAGLSYKQTGLVVNNTEINDFGISFGVGLPVGKQVSNINLGFELGTRGEAANGLVKENYFNFRVGLSLSDKWFKVRKLN